MVMLRRFFVLSVLVAAAGCEQETQKLPFDVDAATTGTVTSQGGVVSNAGGASVSFPSGSLASNVQVSVTPSTVPASLNASGAAASDGFKIEPEGTTLTKPAELELKFAPTGDRAWLASVVGVSNGTVREYGATRVDLSTGVAAADIVRLGSFAVVIPEASAVYRVQAASRVEIPIVNAVQPGQRSRTVSVNCGAPGNRCTGLTVTATQNLLDQVKDAAAVYPKVSGTLTINGASASGSINASAAVRVQLESGQTAESIELVALLQPTAGTVVTETDTQLRLTNVLHRVSGGTSSETAAAEEVTTLVINKSSGNGSIVIDRDFNIRVSGGSTQSANVAIAVPVQLNP
jgi:hypothetical protein